MLFTMSKYLPTLKKEGLILHDVLFPPSESYVAFRHKGDEDYNFSSTRFSSSKTVASASCWIFLMIFALLQSSYESFYSEISFLGIILFHTAYVPIYSKN